MERSRNRQKHESRNPIQRALIARFHTAVLDAVKYVGPQEILDVGCGEGYVLSVLAQFGVPAKLNGIDLSPDAIALAKSRLGTNANLNVADARTLVSEERKFDLVMMLEVLEHLDTPQDMLPILHSLAHRYVLLSVPHEPYFRTLNLLRGKNISRWGNDPEHVQNWGRKEFCAFVSSHFNIVSAPRVFPWTMVLAEKRTLPLASAN